MDMENVVAPSVTHTEPTENRELSGTSPNPSDARVDNRSPRGQDPRTEPSVNQAFVDDARYLSDPSDTVRGVVGNDVEDGRFQGVTRLPEGSFGLRATTK